MTVTASVAVAHGITPGQTGLTLAGFTPSGFNASNYAALAGTAGTTLVIETTTGGGTCPASTASVEGTALVGTGATITIPAFSTTNPIGTNYSTGITVKSNDKFCAVVGEYGADSATPGVQFMHMVDPNGNAFPGAPAAPPILNQGALNFTGYILNGTQDTNFTFVASFGTSGVASTTMTVTGTPGGRWPSARPSPGRRSRRGRPSLRSAPEAAARGHIFSRHRTSCRRRPTPRILTPRR